ncbi:MAG: diguanylate cyclase [Algicola sp.]|nr:diguanylate cyclase [Algicola sp.]
MANQTVSLSDSKILVVDDTPANIDILASILEADGYAVSFATSGEKAIQLTLLGKPALILLDVMMPGMNGFETCRQLKANPETADIPVIFVTAKTQAKDIATAFEAGGVDYISKPVRQEEVSARVRTHLELRALIHQRDELISQLKGHNEEIRLIARQDPLTKLANRRYFSEVLDKEWANALRDASKISIIMFDIDFFKFYNDLYGHQEGDRCIEKVARTLESSIKNKSSLVARYGGEEFIAILPSTDEANAILVAKEMCGYVEALQILHGESAVAKVVTISVGVATCIPTQDYVSDSLIKSADNALYQAKKAGRNQVYIVPD